MKTTPKGLLKVMKSEGYTGKRHDARSFRRSYREGQIEESTSRDVASSVSKHGQRNIVSVQVKLIAQYGVVQANSQL